MEDFHTEIIPEQNQAERTPIKSVLRAILEVIETAFLAILLYFAIDAVTARIQVESISMQPTLYAGYRIIVNKLAYKLGSPTHGDIVVFNPPDGKSEPFIKRVIGLPGDVIRVSGGHVYINDVMQTETYINEPPDYDGIWSVPNEALFVLGDNRNLSHDSHRWGMLPYANIIGKAEVIYWPPSAWTLLSRPTTATAATP